VLGHNGAGKTTTIRMLATLLRPDAGSARVLGHDIVEEADAVRGLVSLTGQLASVDEDLTGRENLVLVGRLGRMPKRAATDRAAELLELFSLSHAADRVLRTYSGGMRRRLDLAASLMFAPPVLFLDEPTTGLDPRSRLELWDVIAELRRRGTTIVLTTQYLEEADRLADSISVIDAGKIIAEGTADELKRKVGGDVLDLTVSERIDTDVAATTLARAFEVEERDLTVDHELGLVLVPVGAGSVALVEAVRVLDGAGVRVADLGVRRPSLDDVFLSLTGHVAEEARTEAPAPRTRRPIA
jgi:ABC-2 type transport system ATP-binding protein